MYVGAIVEIKHAWFCEPVFWCITCCCLIVEITVSGRDIGERGLMISRATQFTNYECTWVNPLDEHFQYRCYRFRAAWRSESLFNWIV